MRDYFDMCFAMFGMMASVVAVIIGGVLFWAYGFDMPSCKNYGELTGKTTNFSISNGCLVKVEDQWVDIKVLTSRKQEVTIRSK